MEVKTRSEELTPLKDQEVINFIARDSQFEARAEGIHALALQAVLEKDGIKDIVLEEVDSSGNKIIGKTVGEYIEELRRGENPGTFVTDQLRDLFFTRTKVSEYDGVETTKRILKTGDIDTISAYLYSFLGNGPIVFNDLGNNVNGLLSVNLISLQGLKRKLLSLNSDQENLNIDNVPDSVEEFWNLDPEKTSDFYRIIEEGLVEDDLADLIRQKLGIVSTQGQSPYSENTDLKEMLAR